MKTSLLLLALAFSLQAQVRIPGPGGEALSSGGVPALIQQCTNNVGTPTTTNTCTFMSNITAGDSLKLFFGGNGGSTCASLSFSGPDTFVQDSHSPQTSGFGDEQWLYVVSSSVGGYNSITVTTTACDSGLQIYEVSNSTTEDLSAGTTGNSAAPSGGALTTTNANDFLGTCFVAINSPGTITVPTGYTFDLNPAGTPNLYCAHRIVSATGTYTDNWATMNSIHWDAIHGAWK